MKTLADYGITNLTGSGVERATTCPQCSSARKKKTSKCLYVNIDKMSWLCHHCGWKGCLKDGPQSDSNPYLWKAKDYTKPLFIPKTPEQSMLEWFKKRGITEEVVKRNQIRKDVIYMPQTEQEEPVICFPFLKNGEIINVKYRDKDKNFRSVAGAMRIFYGLDDIAETTYIVEGEIDKLSLEVAGFKNCISVPDGAPAANTKDYTTKFDFLDNCKIELEKVKSFVLAVDNDEPGQLLEQELVRRFGMERCLRVVWPEGCKDANDTLVKHGVEALQLAIYNSVEFPLEGVIEINTLHDRVINLYRHGYEKGAHPGWEYMASHYTVREGQMTVVTGIPQHGKSEWVDALMVNLAKDPGWCFGVYSPENYPIEQHVAKLCEKYLGKPFREGPTSRMSEAECSLAMKWANEHFLFLGLEEEALGLESILEKATRLVFRNGIKGLLLDPWNELEHQRPNNLSETEYISKCLTKIRYFARKYMVHVWIIAHPTKLLKEKNAAGKMSYPVPTPYDISGSAHWFNKADNCITVWRDLTADYSPTHVYTQKIKFKAYGKLGRVLMDYDTITGRYRESIDQQQER